MLENESARMLDRYQFASAYFDDIEVNYKTGYSIEVGDIVPFGGEDLKITDLQTGKRGSRLQLYEVINKSLNVKNGRIKLSLVSTSFDTDARYAVISLSSSVDLGSTTTRVKIAKTNDTGEWFRESDKWESYRGQKICVRSHDYTFDPEVILRGVDPADDSFLLLDSALPSAPLAGYIVEPAYYDDSSADINQKFKIEFAHNVARVKITAVTSAKVFQVDTPEKLVIGSFIVVNSDDYQRDSLGQKVKIDSIVGAIVTLDKDLPFTPVIGDIVNNSRFLDDGNPYLII
jgi:hypothetical protein